MIEINLTQISAMSKNRVIGRAGGLPWHIPEDLKFFKEKTKGKIMIMGRRTFDSLPGVLPNRLHIVISKVPDLIVDNDLVKVVTSIPDAYSLARQNIPSWPSEVMIVGGGEIYKQTINDCAKIYLSVIDQEIEGDTYFPNIPSFFKLQNEEQRSGTTPFKVQTWIKN